MFTSKKTLLVLALALVMVVPAALGACKDTNNNFPITLPLTGKKMNGDCKWVGRSQKRKTKRCEMDGVSAACPKTCGTCATCADPADIRFRFKTWHEKTQKRKKLLRSCDFVKNENNSQKESKLCEDSGNVCRATCLKYSPTICD